jgi:dienelactone hydrolase
VTEDDKEAPVSSTPAVLEGFECVPFDALGETRDVWWAGSGPAVIVISEIPGITPLVTSFARRVAAREMTVAMPHLFGNDGRTPTTGHVLRTIAKACVSREFTVLATGRSSPVVEWLRALARHAHDRCGGPGVGVVGMCFTGGFALSMMADAPVVAPVLSQPSLPFSIGTRRAADLGCSVAELAAVRAKVDGGAEVLGLRFTGDPAVKAARFEALRQELGDGFLSVELDSSPGNPYGHRKGAHSVLTEDLIDREGSPTMAALTQVLDFLTTKLHVATAL